MTERKRTSLINAAAVRRAALAMAEERYAGMAPAVRRAYQPTRVSERFLADAETALRLWIDRAVRAHSNGRTL